MEPPLTAQSVSGGLFPTDTQWVGKRTPLTDRAVNDEWKTNLHSMNEKKKAPNLLLL